MIRILFCNISYLPYYNTRLDRVAPKNGGAYVAKMHDAYEKHNFEECADGQYRGFVETKYRIGYEEGIATNTYNSLHIERIDPFAKGKTYLDDVLVVFCAKPENSQTVIVGWYKNATVFRRRPFYNGRFFNIQADRKDGFLLPEDQRTFGRERVFHTPYNLRSKVSTNRYSIAGYPSLYLGTSLELCCEETHINPRQDFALASIFKLERTLEYSNTNIQVIELGVKPQDFLNNRRVNERFERRIESSLLDSSNVRAAYMLWYPLIAACSYIRVNKNDPFAAEYIIPQLLMQWVRSEIGSQQDAENEYDQLIGIRYFSCASNKASDMGFNYVFPTSGKQKSSSLPYCSVLAKSFYLSKPVYVHEFEYLYECERYLRDLRDFAFIDS